VILNIRVLAIVLLATTAVACTIGSLPPQPGQDAATALAGAGGNNTGASVDAANVGTRIEAGTNSGGAGTMGGTGGAAVGGTAIGGSIATGGATISGGTTTTGGTTAGGGTTSAGGTSGGGGGDAGVRDAPVAQPDVPTGGAGGGASGISGTGGTGDIGGTCILNSDCTGYLACTWGKCHVPCIASADCPTGESCVKTSDTDFCQLPAEVPCSATSSCGTGLSCAPDQHCRASCQSAEDCTARQVCASNFCADPSDPDLVNGQLPRGTTSAQAPSCAGGLTCGSDSCCTTINVPGGTFIQGTADGMDCPNSGLRINRRCRVSPWTSTR